MLLGSIDSFLRLFLIFQEPCHRSAASQRKSLQESLHGARAWTVFLLWRLLSSLSCRSGALRQARLGRKLLALRPRSSRFPFFPTTLCGVLVFDSVSRVASSSRLLPPVTRPTFTYNNFTHTNLTHNFVTYHLSHTITSHTHKLNTQLCHIPSFTYNNCGRRGTISHPPSFRMAGVALMALGGALGLVLVARDAAALLRGRRGTW